MASGQDGAGAFADCPAGQHATGGGVSRDSVQGNALYVRNSAPVAPDHALPISPSKVPTGWYGSMAAEGGDSGIGNVYVLCVPNS